MKERFRILVVDDDPSVQKVIRSRLDRKGHEVYSAASGEDAVALAHAHDFEVVICDIRMPGMDGFEVLSKLRAPTILVTGHGDKESAIRAVSEGAFSFFEKPFDLDALEVAVYRAGERYRLLREREDLLKKLNRLYRLQKRELESFRRESESRLIGVSPKIEEIRGVLKRLAQKPQATLLVLGETGTGKEMVAQELHALTFGEQSETPFLALNCATVPAELFESELFGHEKGSFSGAHQTRIGLAEAVREGTLFLDEIGEMDARHQAKLLRFLQDRKFRRVGSNKELSFRGRVIAATHRNLKRGSREGSFREDLFYRLNIVSVELPPLRERGPDIQELAVEISRKYGLKGFKDWNALFHYSWPGNVRELANWIERAAILELHDDEGTILQVPKHEGEEAGDKSHAISQDSLSAVSGDLKERRRELLDHYDRIWIEGTLKKHQGNISQAARDLGLDRKNLTRRMKELEIASNDIKLELKKSKVS